jgi:perosamine synthetase
MPMYAKNFQRHPIAEDLGWRGINLPSYPDLTAEAVAEISASIRAFLTRADQTI